MTNQIETLAAGTSTILSGVAGSKVGGIIAQTAPLPGWVEQLLGPFGALIGVCLALAWMAKRLSAAEAREETRRVEREQERRDTQEILVELVSDTKTVTAAAVEVMREVKQAVQGCPGRK